MAVHHPGALRSEASKCDMCLPVHAQQAPRRRFPLLAIPLSTPLALGVSPVE